MDKINTSLYNLKRICCPSGKAYSSNLKQWHNKDAFRDISVKYVLKGTEYYFDLNRTEYKVNKGQILLCSFPQNSGGECIVDSHDEVEGICLYIKPVLVKEIFCALKSNKNELDGFLETDLSYPNFFNHIFSAKHTALEQNLKIISSLFCSDSRMVSENIIEEQMVEISEKIVLIQFGIHESISRFNFLKESTRKEIMKRMLVGKDFIEDNYLNNPTLDEISAYARLSKYHFLRNFKLAFKQSPFEFIQDKRLQYAKAVIEKREKELKDIASLCSFADLAAFSKAFKKKFGVSPSVIQKMAQPKRIFLDCTKLSPRFLQ